MEKVYLIQSLDRKEFKKQAKKGLKLKDIWGERNTAILANKLKKDAIKNCRKWNNEKSMNIYYYTELNVY